MKCPNGSYAEGGAAWAATNGVGGRGGLWRTLWWWPSWANGSCGSSIPPPLPTVAKGSSPSPIDSNGLVVATTAAVTTVDGLLTAAALGDEVPPLRLAGGAATWPPEATGAATVDREGGSTTWRDPPRLGAEVGTSMKGAATTGGGGAGGDGAPAATEGVKKATSAAGRAANTAIGAPPVNTASLTPGGGARMMGSGSGGGGASERCEKGSSSTSAAEAKGSAVATGEDG